MSDAEARAKAEEWLREHLFVTTLDGEASSDDIASLAALLRDAGAGTWSKDRPVHEGWYWTRAHGETAVTEVRERSTRGRLCADLNGGWYPLSAPALFGREWSGPIPEPR